MRLAYPKTTHFKLYMCVCVQALMHTIYILQYGHIIEWVKFALLVTLCHIACFTAKFYCVEYREFVANCAKKNNQQIYVLCMYKCIIIIYKMKTTQRVTRIG